MYANLFKTAKEDPADAPGYFVKSQCSTCKHLNRENPVTCAAFPGGIPMVILMGEYDHTFEFSEGKVSDSGITYSHLTN